MLWGAAPGGASGCCGRGGATTPGAGTGGGPGPCQLTAAVGTLHRDCSCKAPGGGPPARASGLVLNAV